MIREMRVQGESDEETPQTPGLHRKDLTCTVPTDCILTYPGFAATLFHFISVSVSVIRPFLCLVWFGSEVHCPRAMFCNLRTVAAANDWPLPCFEVLFDFTSSSLHFPAPPVSLRYLSNCFWHKAVHCGYWCLFCQLPSFLMVFFLFFHADFGLSRERRFYDLSELAL